MKLFKKIFVWFVRFFRTFKKSMIKNLKKESIIDKIDKIKEKIGIEFPYYMERRKNESYNQYRWRRKEHGKSLRVKAGRWILIWNSDYGNTYVIKKHGVII